MVNKSCKNELAKCLNESAEDISGNIKVGTKLLDNMTQENCEVIERKKNSFTVKYENDDTQEFDSDYRFDIVSNEATEDEDLAEIVVDVNVAVEANNAINDDPIIAKKIEWTASNSFVVPEDMLDDVKDQLGRFGIEEDQYTVEKYVTESAELSIPSWVRKVLQGLKEVSPYIFKATNEDAVDGIPDMVQWCQDNGDSGCHAINNSSGRFIKIVDPLCFKLEKLGLMRLLGKDNKPIGEAAGDKNDLETTAEILKKELGFDVEYIGRKKNVVKYGFKYNKELEDKISSMSYADRDKFFGDLAKALGDKVTEIYITNGKYDDCRVSVYVTDDFVDGIDRYNVDALIADPEKAKAELKFDELAEKICNLIGWNVNLGITLEQNTSHRHPVGNEGRIVIATENLIKEAGIMKAVFKDVRVNEWTSIVESNEKDGTLEAYLCIHFSWVHKDGGSNGGEVGTLFFKNGSWEIHRSWN